MADLEELIEREPRDPVKAAKQDWEAVLRKHRPAIKCAIRTALKETQHDR